MAFNNEHLEGIEAEVKTINNVITSTLRGCGKFVLISGEMDSAKCKLIKFAQDILILKPEVFSCTFKGEEFISHDSILECILYQCSTRYQNIYKKIVKVQGYDIQTASIGRKKASNTMILDVLELIMEEYPLILIIDRIDLFDAKSMDLLKDISCFIPYNRFTIICTLKNTDGTEFIKQFNMEDFTLKLSLVQSQTYEITDNRYIASLFSKSGFPSSDINLIIKLFLQCSIQLMDNNISQIFGLMQYLNDDDSLNYYEAMAYYIILLLGNGRRYEALLYTKQIGRKLTLRIKKMKNDELYKTYTLRCFILGSYYYYINKGNAAINILEKGLSFLDPDFSPEYKNAMGCAYMCIGDWKNAEKFFLKAYESSMLAGSILPHLHVNLIQLYNFKCEFNRASYYYKTLKEVNLQFKNDFVEILLDLLFMPISTAIGDKDNNLLSYELLMNRLLNKTHWINTHLYHLSYLRLYIIAGDHLFRCKDYKNSMKLYEKALINYKGDINEPYMKDFINIRIMACRSMLGFRAGKFILNMDLNYKTQSPFQKYMLSSILFFAYFVYLSSGNDIEAKIYLIRSIRYSRSSGNLIYKGMGYYQLYKHYCTLAPKKAKLYHKYYLEAASAMGISPDNIPYTYTDTRQEDDERINCIIDFIKNNYKKDISLSMLSDEIHLSETHICHLIKEKTGYKFKELLLHTRIQEARKMLTGTVLNISDIASAVGFSSSKYFCEVFKEMCGFTPNSYRKKHHNHNIKEFV